MSSHNQSLKQWKEQKAKEKKDKTESFLTKKYKVLIWADSPTASTGFGTVTKYICEGLYRTGKFDIDILGINFFGEFYDREKFPYQITPAKLLNPSDPYGKQMFINALIKNQYDFVWVMNDIPVLADLKESINKVKEHRIANKQTVPRIIFYYPVDSIVVPGSEGFFHVADYIVSYSKYGKEETLKIKDTRVDDIIYLGVDTFNYQTVDRNTKQQIRQNIYKIDDPNTCIIINVNRNSIRKDVAKTIHVFSEFRKQVPNSLLYLHMAQVDAGAGSMYPIDLRLAISHLGIGQYVKFPISFDPASGYPLHVMNHLYNGADIFITTHKGGGFELPPMEAAACKIPVVAPDNTITPELLGSHRDKAWIYDCKEVDFIDRSGYRKMGRSEDILNTLMECYKEKDTPEGKAIVNRAYNFATSLSWVNIQKLWVNLFDKLISETPVASPLSELGLLM